MVLLGKPTPFYQPAYKPMHFNLVNPHSSTHPNILQIHKVHGVTILPTLNFILEIKYCTNNQIHHLIRISRLPKWTPVHSHKRSNSTKKFFRAIISFSFPSSTIHSNQKSLRDSFKNATQPRANPSNSSFTHPKDNSD